MKKFLFVGVISLFSLGSIACDSTAGNANGNRNVNVNMNRATPAPSPTFDRSNTNVSRADYDKNRAEYEKDRGTSSVGQGVNDSWIWFKTRAALAAANDLRDSTINVDVANDVVTLKGSVANAAQKASAEKTAKGIEGVKSVKNELTVNAAASALNPAANTANMNKR